MGLPSGNRWAVSNLDANGQYFLQDSPFQYEGSFNSWGNVTPHNPINETEFGYDFGGINSVAPWYDGQPYGDTPGSLLTGDIPLTMDVVRKMLGSPWRIPTIYDFQELINNTDFVQADGITVIDAGTTDKRVTVEGVLGIYLKSKINGNLLFFACSGYGESMSWGNRGSHGYYWSSSFNSERFAYSLYFDSGGVNPQNNGDRYYGFSIRPIWNPRDLRG